MKLSTLLMTPEERVAKVKSDLERLVDDRFGGDQKKAFHHFAGKDRALDTDELKNMLSAAGVGEWAPLHRVVEGAMDRFDVDPKDRRITWREFQAGKNR